MSLHASQRATTSSRHPGVVFTGVVYIRPPRLHVCEACGGWTFFSAPHAPRWTERDGRHVQADCSGAEVRR